MGDNNQTTPQPPQKRRRPSKYDRCKLPTPPPDPNPENDKNKEVFDYLESLHKNFSRSASIFAPAVASEEAFDHLEKLYKLMEQMIDLREQNGKLHRRIRDLEYLNNLEKMHKHLEALGDKDCPELDKDTAFAETILESILQDTIKSECQYQKQRSLTPASLGQSILRRKISGSGADKPTVDERVESQQSKVSKWTKVKAAFKWEKASTSMTDAKSQDSGVHMPLNCEIARYLRVPSTSDETGHSQGDSGAGVSTPGSLSTASSNEDFQRGETRAQAEDLRSSEDENPTNYIPNKDGNSSKLHPKYLHPHRTPWSKMKDIIQTKGSFKKKHRLSAASDDIQIDIELCTDNEEVFDDEHKAQISSSPSPNPSNIYVRLNSNDLPREIVKRYQRALAEDTSSERSSKWTKVKKAFISSEIKQNKSDDSMEDEIQKSYRQLQKKLSLEFQEKLFEWDKLKHGASCNSNPSTSSCGVQEENSRDADFIKKMEEWEKIKNQSPTSKQRSAKEIDLPPDFKKKLQEWEKIKKIPASSKKKLGDLPKWKSVTGHRPDNSPTVEYPVLTEEFRRKLEEWKEIKARGEANWTNFEQKILQDKTPSPKLSRKSSGGNKAKKSKEHEKELHWFEKELNKIEKEKQRLERERQKFLEREERLSKLRRSVVGSTKKEVLVHTPCGMYKFEGISRKFTQKLYEWEKSQGIAPEASTFALLSTCNPEYMSLISKCEKAGTPPITRSKSADSVAVSPATLTCPVISKQPSSLSLNDVENLEKDCLDSKSSSLQFLLDDEPEAVLVEVEDYEEETASPLKTYTERKQVPVYQRQETRALCEGETVVGPKVRRSESKRAQTNYSLIEDIVILLRILAETEVEIKTARQLEDSEENKKEQLEKLNDSQKLWVNKMTQKLCKLQEANNAVALNIAKEEEMNSSNHVLDILEVVQDLSAELLQLSENLEETIMIRLSDHDSSNVFDVIKEMRSKMLELRRNLSYVCAASDLTAPFRKRSFKKKTVHKTQSNESKESRCDTTSDSREGSEKGKRYIKSENANINSQGAIKKRIRYRQKSLQRNITDTDDDEDDQKKNNVRQHKKLTRTRSVSESNVQIEAGPSKIEEVLPDDSPVTVFVKTTRKLFTPIAQAGVHDKPKLENMYQRPPLPASPVPQRKVYKDVSPGIRLMISKYNQKIDQEGSKSPGSSGSSSPIWRSPTSERRVKAQTERYQGEISKLSPLLGHREVQKSASTGIIQLPNKQITIPARKNSLTNECCPLACTRTESSREQRKNLTLDGDPAVNRSPDIRRRKLQLAKEEFLKSSPASAPPQACGEALKFPERNRLSQISVDSGSSFGSICMGALIKSASAGMINVDEDTYKQFDPEYHGGGYVSLPRSTAKIKEGLLSGKNAFSNIASKFRKVKMRRGKEKNASKMSAVSTLCRQSLVVDIARENATNNNNGEAIPETASTSSVPISKSSSWIKRTMFKK